MEENQDHSIRNHKHSGYLCVVLSISPANTHNQSVDNGIPKTLNVNTSCDIFRDGPDVGFVSSDGFVMSLINSNSMNSTAIHEEDTGKPLKSKSERGGGSMSVSKKKLSKIGLVHGSASVVHQLHALVNHKCLKIASRVVRIARKKEKGEMRVVVLVDVYLPIALWSGWQFPRSRSTAGALFRHLSCDWQARGSMMDCNKPDSIDDHIWNVSDCHVLGCNQHCNAPDTSQKKLFELHEIFRSLPSVSMQGDSVHSKVNPADDACTSGFWLLPDDVLVNILTALDPLELLRVSSTCRHLRSLAATIMPSMKLKLFPHQQSAVEWMLKRERDPEVFPNPLYLKFATEDGFAFNVSTVSGEVVTGTIPMIKDFRGGMFCDEPGLGKTITALSLILKTLGTLADPPEGVEIIWCKQNGDQKCGYYELGGDSMNCGSVLASKKITGRTSRRGQTFLDNVTPGCQKENSKWNSSETAKTPMFVKSAAAACTVQCTRSWTKVKRNLLDAYEGASYPSSERKVGETSKKRKLAAVGAEDGLPFVLSRNMNKRTKKATVDYFELNETWVQCDACRKWRKLVDSHVTDSSTAWFCSMNSDPFHQSCSVPEESWDNCQSVTYLPGFYTKGTSEGKEENVSFFASVLKEHYALINFETKKALIWLAKLTEDKLFRMETTGLVHPLTGTKVLSTGEVRGFHKIFQAFGLVKRLEQGTMRWHYPRNLVNLAFDLAALRIALCEPLDSVRFYLSRATLIVVPANLVDHWKNQIQKHVKSGQLRVYVWADHKKPSVHNVAWDYDVVITTFSRLSAEWSPKKRSVLMQVHWLRVMFDEGHTLGSSLNLTNKLQLSVSLTASNRWLLTGTPTSNTPNSQLSNLQPMLKFLREEAYGQDQTSWEAGILRPFEAKMEEGRARLLQLLRRCMISARKKDLRMIPPCIKKVTFLNFNEEHARSYNELVVTVRRNILMADWNDPSHIESLLNPKQWKFRSTTIRNVRLSCCVAGHIKVTDAGQDIQETMDILVENGLDPLSEEYAFIRYNILYGGNCMRCEEWCRLPVITPCRHLLCLSCVALNSEKCTFPGCDNLYEMQSPETLARPENPNPKWPVPKDLIELQPSYKQDDWNPDWQSTSSSKVSYLVKRLKDLLEAKKIIDSCINEGHDGKEIDEFFSPFGRSKASARSINGFPEKVLIFSQFLEHIHVIEQQLTVAGIKFVGMYSPMHSVNKVKSLATFQYEEECMALLMDGSAALGLDLSFVTHVFLMEPIWDKSMEEQVISRAHRMGATRPIHVETLAMHGTIEEQMLKFLQDTDECRKFLKEEYVHEGARARRTLHDFAESNYLAQLSFVRKISKNKEPEQQ
ncbi:F-box protein At3g54460 isoform X2 [Cynara cardunculus var. scolymus]|uniref:F-box domain, cyclin-like protein n=1 Tax=Cynara cardunculus var. scolymus TaxID=59895 RepID=A0A124SEP8_CYNCS|nr:F-box protein At3g54460 isoform X2 [Cynara cardunculus var. scolymus]KVI00736.1 F-box domain, cyclin-like protein [Cynara cardunculus var. scolymus]